MDADRTKRGDHAARNFPNAAGLSGGVLRWGEDMYLWLRTREQGAFEYIREPLTFYRRNTSPGGEQRYPLEARKRFERLVLKRFGDRANSCYPRRTRTVCRGGCLNSALCVSCRLETNAAPCTLTCADICAPTRSDLIRRGNLIGPRRAQRRLVRLFAMLTSKNSPSAPQKRNILR